MKNQEEIERLKLRISKLQYYDTSKLKKAKLDTLNKVKEIINNLSILPNPIFNGKINKGIFIDKKELNKKLEKLK
jgi:hypothetical protein